MQDIQNAFEIKRLATKKILCIVCIERLLYQYLMVVVQFSKNHLLKRLALPHCTFLPPLSKIRCPQVHGFISELSILFCWSVFLFFYQNHTLLMIIALQYSRKSRRLIPSAPFCFLRIALAIQGLLCFHTKCEIFYSSSVRNDIGYLLGIALNLQIAIGSIVIFIILILPTQERGIFLLCLYHL